MRFFTYYLSAGGGPIHLIEVKGGAQEEKFMGGTAKLADEVSGQYEQKRIEKSRKENRNEDDMEIK